MPDPIRPTLVRSADRRETATPNATMITLASPTLGGADASLWWVDMPADTVGPWHAFAGQVLWAVTDGTATLETGVLDPVATDGLSAGDTAVLPGGMLRRFTAGPGGFRAVVTTTGDRSVRRDDDSDPVVPPWVA